MNEILTAIQTIGLPAVMVLLEAWYIKYQHDNHSEETKNFTKALHENTCAILELKNLLK